jgi:hypothetical protein
MAPKEFVARLAALSPSLEELERLGLSLSGANDFRSRYVCPRRPEADGEGNEVLALLQGWDLSKVRIGMVGFRRRTKSLPGRVCIGYVEADPLVVIHATSEVQVEELHTEGHVLWEAAKDGAALLDALLAAAEFLTARALCKIDFEDNEAAKAAAARCVTLAGGERYRDFYSMLLGAE